MLRHKTTRYFILAILGLGLLQIQLSAQIAIGEWRSHLPYHFSTKVMLTNEKAFCSSTGGLFTYGLRDNSLETLSKSDGLSDNGIVTMEWNKDLDLAVLAYENANIDILLGNEVINIPDIMKKQIPGEKDIYNIYFYENKAYLACGFGIVVLNLQKFEVSETYYIGDSGDQIRVNQVASDDNYLYAATESGIRRADINNPFLIDFNSWELVDDLPYPSGFYKGFAVMDHMLFAVFEDDLQGKDVVFYKDSEWQTLNATNLEDIHEIRVLDNQLILTGEDGVNILNDDLLQVRTYEGSKPRSTLVAEDGTLWIADYGVGLVQLTDQEENQIKPNGPFSSIAFKMDDMGGKLYSVSGGVTPTYNNVFRSGILMRFENETWRSKVNYDYLDLIDLAVDPNDDQRVFASSWGYGLLEYRNWDLYKSFGEENSSLESIIPGSDFIRIGGIDFDAEGNLWMTNTGVSEPISVYKKDSTWQSFSLDGLLSSFPALGDIIITQEGHIWGIIPKGGGLFALNFNGTLDDVEDDSYKLVNVVDENNRVITNEIYSFAEDLNGNIWLGTNQGILVLYSPGSLFRNGYIYANDIIVPRNDGSPYGDPLLETEKVTSIEVDGSNRKWLGTADGGAFLVSENGFEQIYNFNTGNSSLLSNNITDICVEGETGEVFFGTDKGIISFKAEATEGAGNYDDVKVYPNPVREDYDGPIAISGLMSETIVKITDASGDLVMELESFGGQAIWDGTNFNGNRVATGIYLVFLAKRDGSASGVTKILFIH